jgi:hypothetical protein
VVADLEEAGVVVEAALDAEEQDPAAACCVFDRVSV